jgi:hypothetical protein
MYGIVFFVEKDTFVCNSLPEIYNFCLHKQAFFNYNDYAIRLYVFAKKNNLKDGSNIAAI